uniref:Uncharacterized protein n=1 Tax=Anguilla anguilla TaxID=7936 RepID=A0A0E9VST3_ANGAN
MNRCMVILGITRSTFHNLFGDLTIELCNHGQWHVQLSVGLFPVQRRRDEVRRLLLKCQG